LKCERLGKFTAFGDLGNVGELERDLELGREFDWELLFRCEEVVDARI